jgi:hypothetical protein
MTIKTKESTITRSGEKLPVGASIPIIEFGYEDAITGGKCVLSCCG